MADNLDEVFQTWALLWDKESAVTCVLDGRLRQMIRESVVILMHRAYQRGCGDTLTSEQSVDDVP